MKVSRNSLIFPSMGLMALSLGGISCSGSGAFRKLAEADGPGSSAFPSRVVLKTKTETFDLFRYYVIRGGKIYFKLIPPTEWAMPPNEKSDVAKLAIRARTNASLWDWQLYGPEGLPYAPEHHGNFVVPRSIVEISADADQLLAISDEGRVYLKQAASSSLTADESWYDGWGFPESPLILTPEQRAHRALVMGRRNEYALYSEDPAGTEHHFGNMGTSTLYLLNEPGDQLSFTDSGLPSDFSHHLCGPLRSTRRMEAVSASSSTMMVLDSEGRIFTKMEDFDLNGGSAMFFDYTYVAPKKVLKDGEHVLSNWTKWKLPLDDWREHTPPTLEGRASLSRRITILQNGRGNSARELRVAGYDRDGNEGYYSKLIDARDWQFNSFPVNLTQKEILIPKAATLPIREYTFRGLLKVKDGPSLWVDLQHFQFDCTPSVLKVYSEKQSAEFQLHHVEVWTGLKRENPGLDGTPKVFFATIEKSQIPPDLKKIMNEVLGSYEKNTFSLMLAVSRDGALIQSQGFPIKLEAKLDRTSKDPTPPTEALATAAHSFKKGEYSLLDQDGYTTLSSSPALEISKRLDSLDVADVTLLTDKLKANRDMREYLKKLHEYQIDSMNILKWEGETVGVLDLALQGLGGHFIPGVKSFSKRGRALLLSYSEAGQWMIFRSTASYESSLHLLDQRIAAYDATLTKITRLYR